MGKKLSLQTFIISVILILIFGLVFIFGLNYLINKDTKKPNWQLNLPVTTEPISFNLEITNPDDSILSFDKNLLLSGKTSPEATIIVSSEDGDQGLEPDSKGEFNQIIKLKSGLNTITVTAFDSLGNQKQDKRTVFYSEEKI